MGSSPNSAMTASHAYASYHLQKWKDDSSSVQTLKRTEAKETLQMVLYIHFSSTSFL